MDSQNLSTAERLALMVMMQHDLFVFTQFVATVIEMEAVLGPAPQQVRDELNRAAEVLVGDFARFGASA